MKPLKALQLLGCFSIAALPFGLHAQALGSVQKGQSLQRQQALEQMMRDLRDEKLEEAPLISPDEALDIGPQSILRRSQTHRWLEVSLDSQISWTDNMFFNERDAVKPVKATLLTSAAQVSLAAPDRPLAGGSLRPRIGYQHVWMNYGIVGQSRDPNTGLKKSENDFDAATLQADVTQTWNRWQLQLGADWQRLLSHQPSYSDYSEFYRSIGPRWSLSRVFPLGKKHMLLGSYLGSAHFTYVDATPGLSDSDRNNRTEHGFVGAYSYSPTARWVLQPYYRLQLSDFTTQTRTDITHSFNATATYMIRPWLFARAFGGHERRESNELTTPDYRKWDVGLSLSASFGF